MTIAGTGVVKLDRATIEGVDFRRASFEQFVPNGCVFLGCDFRGLTFDHRMAQLFASRLQSVFRDCRFDEADLRRAGPGQSRFERCTFDGARIEKWTSLCGEFIDCHFSGEIVESKFYGRPHGALATLLSPHRSINEFRGNDFTEVTLVDTAFVQGISFADQRWPDDSAHVHLDRIHQRLQRGRLAVLRWKDKDQRQDALQVLLDLSERYGEQQEIVRRRLDPAARLPVQTQRQLWDLLAEPL
ncbi:MAG: pentapeptide repeat-containing protein [Chloroflexi bacterium]|nr:pentapeptide repeat-containing protein [Chloroflexota bacterium]